MPQPIDDLNASFHAHYDEARDAAKREVPVLVVLADSLVLIRGERREEFRITPPAFHVIKSMAHAPPALFALLDRRGQESLDSSTRERLVALRQRLALARAGVDRSSPDLAALYPAIEGVLGACLEHLDDTLAAGTSTPEGRETFARSTRADLDRLIRGATRLQLRELDACVETLLRRFDPEERKTFQVVVTGDHQARARSLGMQYFRARLGESEGHEDRVIYGEGVTDEAGALALVATQRLDESLALAFFGDAKRLQRDVLGDAVRDLLAESPVKKIE